MDDVLEVAKSRLAYIQSKVFYERYECLQDRRFCNVAGAQWDDKYGFTFQNRPRLEVNKVHLSVTKILSEYRNSKINVKFVSMSANTDDKVVDLCNSLFSADQENSSYLDAYNNAFEEAVTGGFGAFKICTMEEDGSDDEVLKRIYFEPIYDADCSVFFDPNSKKFDKSDSDYCFVVVPYDKKKFREDFDFDPSSVPSILKSFFYDMDFKNYVYLAEYYVKETTSITNYIFNSLIGEIISVRKDDIDEDIEDYIKKMQELGYKFEGKKRKKTERVRKYLMSGDRVIEDYGYIEGKCIPVVPVYGKRFIVDGIERCVGHVRMSKDAQRLKNMQLSRLAEIATFSTLEKPIFTPEQVVGHESVWQNDNVNQYAFLTINSQVDSSGNIVANGPVGYTKPPSIPPALAGLLEVAESDIKDILGNYQAGYDVPSNVSARALEVTQNKVDIQGYIYIDNFAKSLKRCGEIWFSMAVDVYGEPDRKIMHYDGGSSRVIDLGSVSNVEEDEIQLASILYNAKMGVYVDVGQTTASQRNNTLKTISSILPMVTDQNLSNILQSLMVMNIDSEGVDDIRKFFRKKLVMDGVLTPTENEKIEIQKEMDAKDKNQNKMQDALVNQIMAESQKSESDAILNVAKSDESKAKTMQILSDLNINEKKMLLEMLR